MPIRRATYEETQQILNLALPVMQEATVGKVKPSNEKALQLMSPFLTTGGYYLVYTKRNVIQGWVGIVGTVDQNTDERVGFINELYVVPAYRKQGIAQKLCRTVFDHFKMEGYHKVQLNVYAGNQAKNLYHRLGFQDVSTLMTKDLG